MVKKKNIRLFKPSVGNEEILEIKKGFQKVLDRLRAKNKRV